MSCLLRKRAVLAVATRTRGKRHKLRTTMPFSFFSLTPNDQRVACVSVCVRCCVTLRVFFFFFPLSFPCFRLVLCFAPCCRGSMIGRQTHLHNDHQPVRLRRILQRWTREAHLPHGFSDWREQPYLYHQRRGVRHVHGAW